MVTERTTPEIEVGSGKLIDRVFDEYRKNEMAIARLKEANSSLKGTLEELVLQEENEEYTRNGV